MAYKEMLSSLSDRFRDVATVKVVFGEPIEAQGKTLIPVARVGFGLGGGSSPVRLGARARGPAAEGSPEPGSDPEDQGGGGGGVMAAPVGVVEVTEEETRFVGFADERKLLALFAAGALVGFLIGRRATRS